MIDVRLAGAGSDPKRLVAAIDAARGSIAPTELPKALLLRLQTLESLDDSASIVKSMAGDLPVLTGTAMEPAARMIFYRALVATKKADEANAMLASMIERHANQPEALFAHLQLANVALAKNDDATARTHFAAIAAAPNAAQVLGNDVYHDVLCNLGVIALKAGDNDAAIASLDALVKLQPRQPVMITALTVLGQARANKQDYANAGAAWSQALSAADDKQKLDLLDRIARVAALRNDHATAIATWKQMAEAAGKIDAMPAASLQVWAGSHYALKQYAEAAALYTTIYESHGKAASAAYEAAASFDAAGNIEQAAAWYALAAKDRAKLPESYAASLDASLASAKLRAKVDDLGRDYWLGLLTADADEAAFNRAVYAVLAIVDAGKSDAALEQKLTAAQTAMPATSDRHYAVAATRLAVLDALDKQKALGEVTAALLTQWTEHEGKLEANRFGTTIAPAMMQFYAGEAARKRGDAIGAMVYYETILAVYPYNEWPDAASLGAARSFAATGDNATAIARLEEIVAAEDFKTKPNRWRTQAAAMLDELKKGQ
jgi:tetratricopeptide (TPR) repeat protein